MNAGDDDLFGRWSRRKQAVRRAAEEAADAAPAGAAKADLERQVPEPGAGEPAEPPPSLEDLTAGSDLSAFLREGVPSALRNAAMRKMWSLDPAIRDHVGLAENAWDFNQPGAMPGFGPLEAGRAVANFLSAVSREAPADPEAGPGAAEAPAVAPLPANAPAVAPSPAKAPAVAPSPASLPPDAARESAEPAEASPPVAGTARIVSAEGDELQEPRPEASTPRHGGAVPR